MDFSKFTFCFFPTGTEMPVAFVPFIKRKLARPFSLPKEIISTLRRNINQMQWEQKEVIPFLFSKDIYHGLLKDTDFFEDLKILVERNENIFWFLGDRKSLENLADILQKKFPETNNYFHHPSDNDTICKIWVIHKENIWEVEEMKPEEIVSFS